MYSFDHCYFNWQSLTPVIGSSEIWAGQSSSHQTSTWSDHVRCCCFRYTSRGMETLTAQIQTPRMHVWALRSTNSPEHARHSLAYQRFVKVGEGGLRNIFPDFVNGPRVSGDTFRKSDQVGPGGCRTFGVLSWIRLCDYMKREWATGLLNLFWNGPVIKGHLRRKKAKENATFSLDLCLCLIEH